jgi:hypothetical protein
VHCYSDCTIHPVSLSALSLPRRLGDKALSGVVNFDLHLFHHRYYCMSEEMDLLLTTSSVQMACMCDGNDTAH